MPHSSFFSRFYGFESPLSNVRYSFIEVDGECFNSVEQYFNYHKAKYFGQEGLAKKIMHPKTTPMGSLRLGRSIKIPSDQTPEQEKEWVEAAMNIMEKGLRAKVSLLAPPLN